MKKLQEGRPDFDRAYVPLGFAVNRVLANARRKMLNRQKRRYERSPQEIAAALELSRRITAERD